MSAYYETRLSFLVNLYLRIPLFLVVVVSPILIFFNPIPGVLFTALALFGITAHEGICMNFTTKKIRPYFSVFGIKSGNWKPMPVYTRLTVVPVREKIRTESFRSGQSHHYQVSTCMARLYDEHSYDYQIVSKGNKKHVLKEAELLATLTHIPFEDFTQP